jgi:hypothetical protein
MAKPRELYSGQAPQAMSLMGQGIADAYARAGEIEGKGYMALGQGIAQGLTGAASAVADYKKMSSQVKADAAAFNSFKDYLPAKFVGLQQAMENDPKASLLDKQQFYLSAKNYLGAAIGQKNKMDQIAAEQKGLFDRAVAGKKLPLDLGGLDTAIDSIWNPKPTGSQTPTAVVPVDQSMQGQDTTQPSTDLAEFLRRKGWSGTGPVPKAWMREFEASQDFPNPY